VGIIAAVQGTIWFTGTVPNDGPVTAVAAASLSSALDWLSTDDEDPAAAALLGEVLLVALELPLLPEEQAAKASNAAADIPASSALRGRDLCRDTSSCTQDVRLFIYFSCSQLVI
jgi:hypothetical protein